MHIVGDTFEFPMVRKGRGFTVVVSRAAIEAAAGHSMVSDEPERWLNDNIKLITWTADRIRPLITPRGARICVESKHIIARGIPTDER